MQRRDKSPVNLTPDQDAELLANGYEVIACLGKAPVSAGWQAGAITPDRLADEREQFPDAVSTGLRTGALVGIDIDVSKWEHATKLRDLIQIKIGATPLRRRGSKGMMLLYRNQMPMRKIVIKSARPDEAKIEILGIGQQLVAFGLHPTAGKPYEWAKDNQATPLTVPFASLPDVTPDQLRTLAAALSAELSTLGYGAAKVTGDTGEEAKTAKSDNDGAPVAEKVLRAALSYLDPNAEREEWRNDIAAIRAANIIGDDDCSIRRKIAHDYSEGLLDRHGRYQIETPLLYTTPEAVDAVFDTMPPKVGGIAVGTLLDRAQKAGWNGNPFSDGKPATEAFEEALADLSPLPAKGKLLRSVPFSALMSRPSAPIEEIIPGLIEKRIATMLAGHGGTHKSRFAQQLGLSIQAGVPILGKVTEPCTFVYLDYENGEAEITRRTQKMRARLKLPDDTAGHYFDMKTGAMDPTKGPLPASEMSPPLALIEDTGITCLPLYFEIYDFLRSIAGHKFVVADSCYNLLNFTGQTKINETSVKAALNLLDYLCAATDSTMIYLWHPSQSGMDRGDASGWSVAWNNTPRARLSLSKVDGNANAFNLKVEKRNNGPAGQIVTLHWSDGVLLPMSAVDLSTQAETFFEACVAVALKAAEHGSPIQKHPKVVKWILDDIETAVGKTPTEREVKDQLASAVSRKRLRYIPGHGKQIAGYYPWTTDATTMKLIGVDTAKEAQQRHGVEYGTTPLAGEGATHFGC